MGAGANATKLTNMVNPQVLADFIDKKLVNAIRLSPLATIDNTLVGRPGDTITLPSFNYIGDAESVNEGADISIAKLTTSTASVQVAKIGKAVEITDEALLAGAGNIMEEIAKQILTSINSGVEDKLITNMASSAVLTKNIADADDAADAIADALTLFGEDLDGDKVLIIPADYYAKLRKTKSWVPNTEIGANMLIRGTVGMIHGCQVIASNRMVTYSGETPVKTGYIVKPGALRIYTKRGTLVEYDRDILCETNYVKGSKIFAPYVFDTSKLIKLNIANPI